MANKLKKNYIIISHYTHREHDEQGGPAHDLRDYLLPLASELSFLELPFPYANDKRVFLRHYASGKLKFKKTLTKLGGPDILQYALHPFPIWYTLLKDPTTYDICFAFDNLTTVAVFPLRALRVVKRLVNYSIDYTPTRFENKFLNFLYLRLDKLACALADNNWVVSQKMISPKRVRRFFVNKEAKFQEIPIGFSKKGIKLLPISKLVRFRLVFLGTLYEKQGLQLIIRALPRIRKLFPKTTLTVIGAGENETNLKLLARNLGVQDIIDFRGFVKDHKEMVKILTGAAVGLATYKPVSTSFTYFADPGKIKTYLGCGLPVITTSVPPISKVISKNKAGEIVAYDPSSFIEGLKKIIKDKKTYARYRQNAISLSETYNTKNIFEKAFKDL